MIDDDQTHPPGSRDAPGPSAPPKLVVVGQGYVGLPVAMRAVEVGYRVVGFDLDVDRVKRLVSGESYVEDVSDERLAAALATGRYRPTSDRPTLRRLRRRGDHGADAAARRRARPLATSSRRPRTLAPLPAPGRDAWSSSRPPTRAPPRSCVRADPRGRLRACAPGADFLLGYCPERIDPGNPHVDVREHAEGRVGHRRRVARRGAGASTTRSSSARSPVSGTRGGRAHQAAREHVPARQHRAGQRARDVRRRPRHRHLGGDRRRVHQAVRLHALHARARASAATACRSTRRYLSWRVRAVARVRRFRFVELANDVNEHMPDYVVRRLHRGAQPAAAWPVNGSRILLLGLAYKRNTGDARESPARHGRRAAWSSSAPTSGPPTRTSTTTMRSRGSPASTSPPKRSPRPTRSCCWSTTTASTSTLVVAEASYVLDTRFRLSGPNVERL